MSKLKAPAYQWYPRDYIASTRVTMMSLPEEAIYRRLLDYCWLEGSIDANPERIQRLIGKEAKIDEINEVLTMFEPHPEIENKLTHPRLDMQRKEMEANSKKRSKAARARGDKEQCTSNASALQVVCPTTTTTTTTTPTTTTTKNKTTTSSPKGDDVEKVWSAYPNKKGKKRAIPAIKKALKKYSKDELIAKIKLYEKSCSNPKYIAHGCTWFCNERYEDDLTPPEISKQSRYGSL